MIFIRFKPNIGNGRKEVFCLLYLGGLFCFLSGFLLVNSVCAEVSFHCLVFFCCFTGSCASN